MRTTALNRNSAALQSGADNARDVAAVAKGAYRRNAGEKYPTFRGLRPRMKHVLGQRCCCVPPIDDQDEVEQSRRMVPTKCSAMALSRAVDYP